jgi:hypothetical protein
MIRQDHSSPKPACFEHAHQPLWYSNQLPMPFLEFGLPFCGQLIGRFRPQIRIAIGRTWRQCIDWLIFSSDCLGVVFQRAQTAIGFVLRAGGSFDCEWIRSQFDLLHCLRRLRNGSRLPVLGQSFLQFDLSEIHVIVTAIDHFSLTLRFHFNWICTVALCYFLHFFISLLALLVREYSKIKFNPFLIKRTALEHRQEIQPFWVNNGIVDMLPEDGLIEVVEVLGNLCLH